MKNITFNEYLKNTFGEKVYKISLEISGLTCPNRDGTCGTGGCIFCLNGSGDFTEKIVLGDTAENIRSSVYSAIEAGKNQTLKKAPDCKKFIAYFQSFTNTYAASEKLAPIFSEAINHKDVVALSIGTRPDCLPDDIIAMLSELNKTKPVFVELGLQTSNDSTAKLINRGYDSIVYENSVKKLKAEGINVVTHLIAGLPGESFRDYENSVNFAVKCGTDGIKIQPLNVLKNTTLANDESFSDYRPLGFEEYVEIVSRLVKLLPDNIVIHRLTGDGPRSALLAPLWCLDKKRVLNAIAKATK